ncbi:MAG TPA: ABC transporter ATP-binding protein [Thermomicrobiales bacterium]|nr:ABC transporter ATP-binding protein [Thermomicrobiales bacterium]
MSLHLSTEPIARMAAAAAIPAIETTGLRKVYGRTAVLHDLALSVAPGEIFGFLGPNGAGKTTTVKILMGLVRPTAGEARIFGLPAGDRAARRRVGYLPENFRFHDWLTGAGLLDFHGRLAGLSPDERRIRIPEVIGRVGLAGKGDAKIRTYSKGMTQRIGLAQAILHRPDLVLLDEPTSALDPVGRREVRDLIRSLRDDGVTVFLNSHLLSEVEMVCDRVAIIDHGRVVRSGGVSELRVMVDRVDSELLAALKTVADVVEAEEIGADDQHGTPATSHGATLTLAVSDLEIAPLVAETVMRRGYQLFGLVPVHRTLEEIFMDLVEGGES